MFDKFDTVWWIELPPTQQHLVFCQYKLYSACHLRINLFIIDLMFRHVKRPRWGHFHPLLTWIKRNRSWKEREALMRFDFIIYLMLNFVLMIQILQITKILFFYCKVVTNILPNSGNLLYEALLMNFSASISKRSGNMWLIQIPGNIMINPQSHTRIGSYCLNI